MKLLITDILQLTQLGGIKIIHSFPQAKFVCLSRRGLRAYGRVSVSHHPVYGAFT